MEAQRFVERRIEGVLFHFGLAFARLRFVGQQVELWINGDSDLLI